MTRKAIGSSSAAQARIPLKVLDLDFGGIPAPYRHALCIARPDGHVAWRGDGLPAQAESILSRMTGQLT